MSEIIKIPKITIKVPARRKADFLAEIHDLKKSARFKGNRYAAKENMSPEAHERRMAGLRKAWDRKELVSNGAILKNTKDKRKRRRIRLRRTLAREAVEIQQIARTHADEAMLRLAEIINNRSSNDSVAIAAAQVLLDRAYGKASQTNLNMNVNDNAKPSESTSEQLDKRIEQTLRRFEAATRGKIKAPQGKKRPPYVRLADRDSDSSTKH